MTNKQYGTLYVGITNNLERRVYEHKNGTHEGFTKKYSLKKLVWYDTTDDIHSAINYEKRIKKWNRLWKIRIIQEKNPNWVDLSISGNRGSPPSRG